ncbi:NAD(P)-binding protein [Paraphaeosphaeria sporulosa]|uniref:NAD(P)-binding protein n=1 Tax=Paraphaeosphaeria sporulosa TaxID=1460663 RepID=A0A177BU92_9PLEO|nr:NAD(P)-binding protein [Paraphaeosphaeria sporulosa]OAF99003.1 NAD(P)-binding protein [Paraphaeosphaeria sporulosa]
MGQRSSLVLGLQQTFWIPAPRFTEKELGDLEGTVTIVTGGYTGIGLQLAHILYGANGTLYIAGRSREKAEMALSSLRHASPNSKGRVEFLQLDLADLSSIKPAVQEFLGKEERLDVLVNNAGVMWPPPGSVGAQGYEAQIATNVYGPFLLTHLLHPILARTASKKESGEVRVCWAGSIGIELAAPKGSVLFEEARDGSGERVKEGLDKMETYGMTKCANVILGVEGARRDAADGIVHVSFNPGNLYSELQRHASWLEFFALKAILYPTKFGAYTELFAGWSPEITSANNGCYVVPWGQIGTYNVGMERAMARKEDGGEGKAERLWEVCWRVTREFM